MACQPKADQAAAQGIVASLARRIGMSALRPAARQAMQILGAHFILGRTIEEGLAHANSRDGRLYRYSFDMLGEGARTSADAAHYFVAYRHAIEAIGLSTSTNSIRAGLVACTGNMGCKFAASDTKRHAEEIAAWCETRVALDTPVNIHLTGCHHSCAQHFVSEIGLLACKVQASEDDDLVEGYHILIGGGFGPNAALGRELYRDVFAQDAPRIIERILQAYLTHRASPEESFLSFARRHEIEALKAMVGPEVVA